MKSALCYSLILLLGIAPAVALAQRGTNDETGNQGRNNSQGNRGQNDSSTNRGQQNNSRNRGRQNNSPNRSQSTPNPTNVSPNQGPNQNQSNRGNVQAQPNNQGRSGNTGIVSPRSNQRSNPPTQNNNNNTLNRGTSQNNPSLGQNVGSVPPTPGVIQPDTQVRGSGNASPGSSPVSPSGAAASGTTNGGAGAGDAGTRNTDAGVPFPTVAPWDGEAFFPDSGKGGGGAGGTATAGAGSGSTAKGATPAGGAGAGGAATGGIATGGTPKDGTATGGAATGGAGAGGSGGIGQGNNGGGNQNNNQNGQNIPSRGQNLGPVDRTPGLIEPDNVIRRRGPGGGGTGASGTLGSGTGGSATAGNGAGNRGRGSLANPGSPRGDFNARGDGRGRGDGRSDGVGVNNNNRNRRGNSNSDYDWRRNNRAVDNYVNATPRYYHGHGNWHRGDWNSFWSPSWGYQPYIYTSLGVRPGYFAFGYTALAAPWTWGYYNYRNPYWVAPANAAGYVDYSQPIIVAAAPAQQQSVLPGVQQTADQQAGVLFDKARAEFFKGDYQQALNTANEAVARTPNDALLHEFRALCLFALKDYQQAAAGLYATLSVGPGWDWETMAGLYGDIANYTAQMRALEDYRLAHPDAADARFLLGYHYLVLGHKSDAALEFEKVVALQPNDQLSKQLLQGITTGDVQPAPRPEPTPAQAVPANSLVGNWNAQSPDGSKFGLTLNGEGEFQWTASRDGKQQEMTGTYKLENDYLILRASAENSLVGQVAMEGDNRFLFKLAGNNPADPGLTFTR